METNDMMKKIGISIFVLFWIFTIVYVVREVINNYKNQEPYIYHLHDVYHCSYYVYPNFRNDYRFIKYLFDFADKYPGSLCVVGNENDVSFEDGIDFINESRVNAYFFFSRPDSSSFNYERIRICFPIKDTDFHVTTLFKNGIDGKKLKGNFDEINTIIVQNFLDYSDKKDYETRSQHDSCIYELYDRNNNLILQQEYTDYGKYFTIEMY